jgi:putative ABC transport system substrate-binding protein
MMRIGLRHIAYLALTMAIMLPLPASSPAASRMVGVFLTSDLPRYREAHQQFMKVFSAKGYAGSSEFILQTPNPDPQSWSNAARKYAAYRTDLIVAYGAPAVAAALKETDGIPIVAADAVLPESNHNEPGLCGISARVPMFTLVKLLQEMRPIHKLGVLYNSREIGSVRQLDDIRKAARQLNIVVNEVNVGSSSGVDSGISQILERSDALIVTESSVICRNFEKIISRTRAAKIPVATSMPEAAERGALVSLEISPAEQGQTAAQVAIKLIEGAKPAQMGIASPKKIELVINLKTARELDINVPFQVLGTATRILR